MKIIKLFIAAICCLMISASPPHPTKQCIDSLPSDDSVSFGFSVATNDKYLAVGDLQANHVVIYTRDKDGRWRRTREILPPQDSTAYKVGRGFGYELALDGEILVISALTQQQNYEVKNPEDFQESNILSSTFTAIYQTRLDRETEVKRIDVPTKGVIPSVSVVADKGKIAFITSREEEPGKRVKQVHLLSNGFIKYILPPKDDLVNRFDSDIALKNNFLLVGVGQPRDIGGAWLYNLNSPRSEPQRLTIPNATLGNSVALSDQFAVVGDVATRQSRGISDLPQKTLIRNIADGSTKVIDGNGKLSLDSNILARMRYPTGDKEIPSLLEVFRLDNNATPHLIEKRSDVERASVQNRLLITVQKTVSGQKICTEQVR
jgi:hypothetical protein